MLAEFMGQCAPNAALLSISSLNEPAPSQDDGDSFNDQEVGDCIADPTIDIESDFARQQLIKMVRRFVYGLSPQLRCIVFRHHALGHTQTQIAHDLGVTRPAICHAIRRVHRLGYTQLAPLVA